MSETTHKQQPAGPLTPLPSSRLYTPCNPDELPFDSTAELEPLADHLGQDRAVDALQFGLNMPHDGYNIYLLGSAGVGKRELLEGLLGRDAAPARPVAGDWCYLNNFEVPDRPVAIHLPRGMGNQLRRDMASAVEELLAVLPATFQSDEYQARGQDLGEQYQAREQAAFQSLAERAEEQGVAMVQTPNGYSLAPVRDGEIIKPPEFEALTDEERERTLATIEELKEELKIIVRQLPGWKKEARERFKQLNSEFSHLAIDPVFAELKESYRDHPEVIRHLEAVHADVIEQAEAFTRRPDDSAIPENLRDRVQEFPQYGVNVLVDNRALPETPVIYEDNPGFANLIGRVEHIAQMGTLVTNFSLIKPGALHRANGGYLILEADKILSTPYAWQALKRALKAREIRIQSLEQIFSFASTVQLQPEPIPLDVKVVLSGDRQLYHLLQYYDPEFATLFKVAADMSEEVERTPESTRLFARLICTLQQEKDLLPLDRDGVARVIEYAARHREDRERLSLHRGRLDQLLAESDYWARQAGADQISAEHVRAAVDAATRRLDQFREKSHEGILRELMRVDTSGTAVGQVNGLAVYLLGDYAFGKPTRITATARLGAGKVLDIEREVDLAGSIHSKAVMIISSLLAHRYARDCPFPLAASLAFEQSYGGIEGDSASVAEMAALISAIAELPLRQSLAVTGSLDQHGRVQAIGGVNEKIEGFFDICQSRGLSGEQGVIIPRANEVHLMLRDDVVLAADRNDFHVYTVDTIDQAMELLTGLSADSVDRCVQARVQELQALAQKFSTKSEAPDDD